MSERPSPLPDALPDLPLFPLGTVVFPGALLPLQIFEPRYLHMVGDCERQGLPFGVVTLRQGSEVHRPGQAESFEPIGTLMRIERVERPRAGLLHIWCRALGRFEVLQAAQRSDGLWRASAQPLPPEPAIAVPEHLQYLSAQMTQALHKLTREPLEVEPWPKPWLPEDCAWLSHRWGELLPLPSALKYRLFALQEPLLRLELIGDMVSSEKPPGPASSAPPGP